MELQRENRSGKNGRMELVRGMAMIPMGKFVIRVMKHFISGMQTFIRVLFKNSSIRLVRLEDRRGHLPLLWFIYPQQSIPIYTYTWISFPERVRITGTAINMVLFSPTALYGTGMIKQKKKIAMVSQGLSTVWFGINKKIRIRRSVVVVKTNKKGVYFEVSSTQATP